MVLLLIDVIKDHLDAQRFYTNNEQFEGHSAMLDALNAKFSSRSHRYDSNSVIAEATFLDPRFKKLGFPLTTTFERTEESITNLAGKCIVVH